MTSPTYQPIRSLKNDVTFIAMVTMMSRDPSRPIRSLKNVVEYKFVGPLILLLGPISQRDLSPDLDLNLRFWS